LQDNKNTLIFDKEIITDKIQISQLKQNLIVNSEVSRHIQIINQNGYFSAKKNERYINIRISI